jgi:hypothetical protein
MVTSTPEKIFDNRSGNEIGPGRNEQRASSCFGEGIERSLECWSIVSVAVADCSVIRQIERGRDSCGLLSGAVC